MAGSGGISPARRRAHDEAAPLVGPAADSPSMGSLKHRGGSLGDVVVAGAGSDERGGLPGSAPARATLFGLTPAVLLCVAVASCGALAFGYHLGVVNGPLEEMAAQLGFGGSALLQGMVVSSLLAGAAVGSLAGASLADSLGRRRAFLLDAVPMLAGPLLSAAATGLAGMLAGRVLTGVGIGLSSALVPLYISEISPTHARGTLGSINQLMICVGILAALLVNVALPATAWRSMFAIAAAPAALLGLGFLFCPESPAWLELQGQRREAAAVAEQLWGPEGSAQLGGGKHDEEGAAMPSWGEVLASKGAVVGALIFVFQQFSGINAIVYYSSAVFEKAGVQSGALASAAVGATNVLGTVVAAGLMDRAGRKQLISWSFAGMGVSMLAMAGGLSLPFLSGMTGGIALVGTLAYILSFALGAGPVPGLLVPEITGARIRGRAVSLAMVTHWVCNFAIGQLFLAAVSAFGVSTVYLFFAAVCFACVAFVGKAVVETKGRSLQEIELAMAAV
ncbi:Plastidic glucose transporter 4 [Micractinium conductrix]|uniref:Plastidic glucose transporter 4 n=1 Tax=Micractinium conductrix TaxID=554055 RepID=A0A2P6VN44_9CHLO|nr:Plastidic glucose transporter 4 [Micractinium conductrix]|eukprot:PSC75514.1 Plastidic glucose transporter 4 [Micractinium conductrix]